MTNKRLMMLVCLITGLCVFAIGMTSEPELAASVTQTQNEMASKAVVSGYDNLKPLPTTTQQNAGAEAQPNDQQIPLHVVYGQVFRHIKDLNRQADEEELKGKDGEHFRTLYQRMAKLKDEDAIALDRIAAEAIKEMDKLDAEAAHLIKKFRQMNPKGSAGLGTPRPKPPAGLMTLLKARREKILAARDKLFQALGDEEFGRFEKFLYDQIVPDIQQIDLTAPLSNR
jgi:uncharacterized coiled-coil protein SlyX